MFSRILFATTSSATCNAPSKVAFDLAAQYNARLFIFHVLGFPTHGFGAFVVDFKTGEEEYCSQDYIARVKGEIEKTYAEELRGLDNYVIETLPGVPHNEILRLARKEEIDLIVMGPHAGEEKGAVSYRKIVGGTMGAVTQRARCPVMIVSRPIEKERLTFDNIVFGTDFSKASDTAFLFAYEAAVRCGSKLYIFHALDIVPSPGGAVCSQEEIEKKLDEVQERIKETYVSRMEGFNNYEIKTWEGVPYMEILKFARRKEADVIVMAHHSREKDPEKAIIGSTVEQVVMRAGCPVISVSHTEKKGES